jgi:hypothetical protein
MVSASIYARVTEIVNAIWLFQGGAHHKMINAAAKGMLKNRRKGRRLPHRVWTFSLIEPTRGSLIASQRVLTRAAIEARRGSIPTTSVRNIA